MAAAVKSGGRRRRAMAKAKTGAKAKPKAKAQAKAAPAMPWEKTRPEFLAAFEALAPGAERGLEKRQMFGYPVRFLNGNMCLGVHNNAMILRLAAADRAAFIAEAGGAIFEPMPGRPMREYVKAPPGLVEDRARMARWVERSLAYVASLPAKVPKATGRAPRR
jgi:hypothetical protein